MPAATSSMTTPTPPDSFLSRNRIGYGFQISSALNNTNPRIIVIMLNGKPVNVKIMPAISSITIHPGSLAFNIFSAAWAIHMAQKMNTMVKHIDSNNPIFDRK